MRIDADPGHPKQYLEFFTLLNQRRYFEAHEVLEDLWVMETGILKDYYKGLIMIAAALLHWNAGNHSAALRLHADAQHYLSVFPDKVEDFPLGTFRTELTSLFGALQRNPETPAPAEGHPVLQMSPRRRTGRV